MRLQFLKLQNNDNWAKTLKLATGFLEGLEDNKQVLWYQGLPYISEIIRSKIINYYHNNLFAKYFEINKT